MPLAEVSVYAPPSAGYPIDLKLDANEGAVPAVSPDELAGVLRAETLRLYPSATGLEAALARRWGISADRVLVTAGGDEAIDRLCRAVLGPGREIVVPEPTFEMIGRYARLAGARVVPVVWPGAVFPIDSVLASVRAETGVVAVVSPNNPTGAVVDAEDLRRVVRASERSGAIVLLDAAYGEFADHDLTPDALAHENVVVVRTFSKAFGLAGLRVGYAVGGGPVIRAMRASGGPYSVSSLSLAAARVALEREAMFIPGVVQRVVRERAELTALLSRAGARALASQGNFVLAEFADAERVWRGLAALGIGVRRFSPESGLPRALRITCPGEPESFARLCRGLAQVFADTAAGLTCAGSTLNNTGGPR
jgi:histidinol-phosphate aminotransferase